MLNKIALGAAVCLFVLSPAGDAHAAKKLTKSMIEDFYAESAKMQMKKEKDLIPFLEKHMSDDMVLEMKTSINIEGAPTQNDETTMDKAGIIKHTIEGLNAGEIHKVEEKLMAVDIAEDERSAKAKDSVYSTMTINVPTPQGDMKFDSETMIFCSDELILNKKDVIQVLKSRCSNEVTMKPQK